MSKREFLAASAVTTAYAIGARALDRAMTLPETRRIALALVDDQSEAGRAFARAARRAGIRTVSVAEEEARLWSGARAGFGLAPGEAAIGFTGWGDWVSLRPQLAEHRKRARVELRVDGARDDVLGDLLAAWRDDEPLHRAAFAGPAGGATRFAWLVA